MLEGLIRDDDVVVCCYGGGPISDEDLVDYEFWMRSAFWVNGVKGII